MIQSNNGIDNNYEYKNALIRRKMLSDQKKEDSKIRRVKYKKRRK